MKIRVPSVLLLLVLVGQALSVHGADTGPPFKSATVPGQLLVTSIDDQQLEPAIKERVQEQVRLMRENKVISVSDRRVPDFAAVAADYRARGVPLSQLIADRKLNFFPANVDATSLRGQTTVGAIPSGVYGKGSWTGLTRMFNHPDLVHVVLEETDLAKTGGGAIFTKEMINADVNGAPAVRLSIQGKENRSETSVMWFSNGVLYLLRTPGVDDKSRDELLKIARSISK